jgi:hypothetical protein
VPFITVFCPLLLGVFIPDFLHFRLTMANNDVSAALPYNNQQTSQINEGPEFSHKNSEPIEQSFVQINNNFQPQPPPPPPPPPEHISTNKVSPEVATLVNVIYSTLNTFALQAADVWVKVPSTTSNQTPPEMLTKYLFGITKEPTLSIWTDVSSSHVMAVPLAKSIPGRIIARQG